MPNELTYFTFPILKLKKIKRKNIGIDFYVSDNKTKCSKVPVPVDSCFQGCIGYSSLAK